MTSSANAWEPKTGTGAAEDVTYTYPAVGAVEVSQKGINDVNSVTPQYFGAVGDGITDDYEAIQFAINTARDQNKSFYIPATANGYRVTQQINIDSNSGLNIICSNGARILKDHGGIGIRLIGGSNQNSFFGTLFVEGFGTFESDTSAASLGPDDHGIVSSGNRVFVHGELHANKHRGNGFYFSDVQSNMNRCWLKNCRANANGVHGIFLDGDPLVDNQAVWEFSFFAENNRQSGVKFDGTCNGRGFDGYIYTENNCIDPATPAGVDIGRLRDSYLFIYAEENLNAAPRSILVQQPCSQLLIFDVRTSKTQVNQPATDIKIINGGRTFATSGDEVIYDKLSMPDATDGSRWAERLINNSSGQVGHERWYGNGTREIQAKDDAQDFGTILQQTATAFRGLISPDSGVSTEIEQWRISNPAAGETSLFLYDADNGSLERVTVGAADSGGVGFKVLRIPN